MSLILAHFSYPECYLQRRFVIVLCVFILLGVGSSPIVAAQADPLAKLSLKQRVAQMFIVNLYGSQLTEAGRDFLTQLQPGGLVLLPENITTPDEVTKLTNVYQ